MSAPEIIYLPLDEIQENPWNPNVMPDAKMMALVANIKRVGFNRVLVVRPNTGQGRAYEIVDGEQSFRAGRAAGVEFVPCVVRMLDDAEARAQTIAMNEIRGEMDPSQVAALVREIDEAGIDAAQLATFTGYTEDEIADLERLLTIDWTPEPAQRETNTTPQGDERWIDLRVRVPYTLATMFRSELDRLKDVRGSDQDHLALELMVVNSAGLAPEQM